MRRRAFIALLGSAAVAWPLVAPAQERMRRLAILTQFAENDSEASQYVTTFREGLEAFGWREGQKLHIDYLWAAGDMPRPMRRGSAMSRHLSSGSKRPVGTTAVIFGSTTAGPRATQCISTPMRLTWWV
jgi:hypothetical protein